MIADKISSGLIGLPSIRFIRLTGMALATAVVDVLVIDRHGTLNVSDDAYAVMAGLDGIAFPAEGAVSVAHSIGRPFEQAHSCCSIKIGSDIKSRLQASFAA